MIGFKGWVSGSDQSYFGITLNRIDRSADRYCSVEKEEERKTKLKEEPVVMAEARRKPNLIWLELNGCSGNVISLLDGAAPDFQYMITQMVNLVYDASLMTAQGDEAMRRLLSMSGQEFILAVEGAVSTKDGGIYQIVGSDENGQMITGMDIVKLLGEQATHVIAVGACASHGGISAAAPNPSESVGVQRLLQREVIQLPGCPCHPSWFLGTLAEILLYGRVELDRENRPLLFYHATIHDHCERRSYFDEGLFATALGDPACMFRLGCKGPMTVIDCPIKRWNNAVNWPVQCNTPCIGCARLGFPDVSQPFVRYPMQRPEAEAVKEYAHE